MCQKDEGLLSRDKNSLSQGIEAWGKSPDQELQVAQVTSEPRARVAGGPTWGLLPRAS